VPNAKAALAASATVDGKSYRLVKFTQSEPQPATLVLYIGDSNLIDRLILTVKSSAATMRETVALANVVLDTPMASATFAYSPPAGATAIAESTADPASANLLPAGAGAPDFTLPTPAGGHVSLAQVADGKRAVMVNFWFHG
jgi:hypothetical protein